MKIRNATKQGYIECPIGGVLNIAFPDSKLRRGRVIENGTIAPTLDTGCEIGLLMADGVKQIGQLYGTEKEPNPQAGRIYDKEGISPCLDSMRGGNRQPKIAEGFPNIKEVRIRRLMPIECFRLQGFPDEMFRRAEFVNSDTQLYKMAGNSVSVPVIEAIAERLEE